MKPKLKKFRNWEAVNAWQRRSFRQESAKKEESRNKCRKWKEERNNIE